MVVVVVIGVPMLQALLLWTWIHPFNQLFIPTEDGDLIPSKAAKRLLGPLYQLYKPWYNLGALVNIAIKLVLTAAVGLIFSTAQGTGMLLSVRRFLLQLTYLYFIILHLYEIKFNYSTNNLLLSFNRCARACL